LKKAPLTLADVSYYGNDSLGKGYSAARYTKEEEETKQRVFLGSGGTLKIQVERAKKEEKI
jgi:hypothetical protein